MTDRFQKLREIASEHDKAELTVANDGFDLARKNYTAKPGKITREDLDAARGFFEETIDRLWLKHFPSEIKNDDSESWFKNKTDAWNWYSDNSGELQKSRFFAKVKTDRKRVSRFSVSEMIRKERQTSPVAVEYSSRKDAADLLKAESDANIKARQDERERREFDKEWLLKDKADEITCVWTARLRDSYSHHIEDSIPAIIHVLGGDHKRISEVKYIIDGALLRAENEIANSPEITVTIEDIEDETGD